MPDKLNIDNIILTALREDMLFGDITTQSIIDKTSVSTAVIIAKQTGIIAGLEIAERTFKLVESDISFEKKAEDGQRVECGQTVVQIKGSTAALLKAERTALNFLQRLSGIAAKTNEFCEKVKGLPVKIVDTRKTTPGLRLLEKYAVKAGGGSNHRFSLSDGVLIKENHIKAAGGIANAVNLAKQNVPHTAKIEIETETLKQVKEALESGADIIMLDNMDIQTMKKAVEMINKKALVEASGNISLDNVYEVAKTGVDIISIGALTHSIQTLDLSMKIT